MSTFVVSECLAERCAEMLNAAHVVQQSGDEELPALIGRRLGELIAAVRACALLSDEKLIMHCVDLCAASSDPRAAAFASSLATASRVTHLFGDCSPTTLWCERSAFWDAMLPLASEKTLTYILEIIESQAEIAHSSSSYCLSHLQSSGSISPSSLSSLLSGLCSDLFEKID
jgi:hypothetical protein